MDDHSKFNYFLNVYNQNERIGAEKFLNIIYCFEHPPRKIPEYVIALQWQMQH